MSKYFAGGHLRFLEGEWRDDNGDVVEITPIVHGEWILQIKSLGYFEPQDVYICSICGREETRKEPYCNCGARMDGGKE